MRPISSGSTRLVATLLAALWLAASGAFASPSANIDATYIDVLGVPTFFKDYLGLDCRAQRVVADEVILSGLPSAIANVVGTWPWTVAPSCL
jgi:hypothetical protein